MKNLGFKILGLVLGFGHLGFGILWLGLGLGFGNLEFKDFMVSAGDCKFSVCDAWGINFEV